MRDAFDPPGATNGERFNVVSRNEPINPLVRSALTCQAMRLFAMTIGILGLVAACGDAGVDSPDAGSPYAVPDAGFRACLMFGAFTRDPVFQTTSGLRFHPVPPRAIASNYVPT